MGLLKFLYLALVGSKLKLRKLRTDLGKPRTTDKYTQVITNSRGKNYQTKGIRMIRMGLE